MNQSADDIDHHHHSHHRHHESAISLQLSSAEDVFQATHSIAYSTSDERDITEMITANVTQQATGSRCQIHNRIVLQRSDSGLSSDSSELNSLPSSDSTTSTSPPPPSMYSRESSCCKTETLLERPSRYAEEFDEEDEEVEEDCDRGQREQYQREMHLTFTGYYGTHSPLHGHHHQGEDETIDHEDIESEYTSPNSTTHYPNHPTRTTSPTLSEIESKLQTLSAQKRILSQKLLYAEEHIIDLSAESEKLQENLKAQEALYRKKLDFREAEIDGLRDLVIKAEGQVEEFKRKEGTWLEQKAEYLQEIESLKQQIASQESELSRYYPLEGQLGQLKAALQRSSETITSLQRDRLDSLAELHQQFEERLRVKDAEIGHLSRQVIELTEQLTGLVEAVARRNSKSLEEDTEKQCAREEERRNRRRRRRQREEKGVLSSSTLHQATTSSNTNHRPPLASTSSRSTLTAPETASSACTSNRLMTSAIKRRLQQQQHSEVDAPSETTTPPGGTTSGDQSETPDSQQRCEYDNMHSAVVATKNHSLPLVGSEVTAATNATVVSRPVRKNANSQHMKMLSMFERHNSSCDTDEDESQCESSGGSSSGGGKMEQSDEEGQKRMSDRSPSPHSPSLFDELTTTDPNNNHTPSTSPTKRFFARNSSLDFTPQLASSPPPSPPNSTTTSQTTGELFPSLPDVMLRKLCLLRENTTNIESLSEAEIDAKFHTLSLAFKTDKFTLDQRVKLYRHQRDVVEADTHSELASLAEYIHELNRHLFSYDSKFFLKNNLLQIKELKLMLDRVEAQCRVIQSAVRKISSRAELYGAVRQEEKLSTAFDVILLHLENLKRAKEKDEKELEDLKRLLSMSVNDYPKGSTGSIQGLIRQNSVGEGSDAAKRRAFRSISGCPMTSKINLIRVRRASVASIDLGSKEVTRRSQVFPPPPTESPVTTTTTTTTFPNGPFGPSTTLTTVSTSSNPSNSNSNSPPPGSPTIELPDKTSRRLSVPAANLARNFTNYRPNLFQFLTDSPSAIGLQEEDSEHLVSDLESEAKDGGESDIHEIHEPEFDDLLQLPRPPDQPENSTYSSDGEEEEEAESETDPDPNETPDLKAPPRPSKRAPKVEERFLSELYQKLKRLEELEIRKRVADSKRFYDKIKRRIKKKVEDIFEELVVKSLTNRSPILLERITSHAHYDQTRYLISGVLFLVSLFIIIYSVLIPLLFR